MKSVGLAYGLWFFFGLLGVHRFYLNRPFTAMLYWVTCAGFGLWWLIDAALIPSIVEAENMEWKREMRGVMGGNTINVSVDNSGSGKRRKNDFDFS